MGEEDERPKLSLFLVFVGFSLCVLFFYQSLKMEFP